MHGSHTFISNIKNKAGLLAQINRCKYGVAMRDLTDAYIGVSEDLKDLMTGGDIGEKLRCLACCCR